MDSFYITLPADTRIYRCCDRDFKMCSGHWFSYTRGDSVHHGTIMGTFRLKKDLKLLNVASDTFYKIFVKRLDLEYERKPDTVGMRNRKLYSILPIGFPDNELQRKLVKQAVGLESCVSEAADPKITAMSEKTNGRCRFSSEPLDRDFRKLLQGLYPDFDGFTSPMKMASTFHDRYSNREIVIFDLENLELEETRNIECLRLVLMELDTPKDEEYMPIEMPTWLPANRLQKLYSLKEEQILPLDGPIMPGRISRYHMDRAFNKPQSI
jgi:hypothetical protein